MPEDTAPATPPVPPGSGPESGPSSPSPSALDEWVVTLAKELGLSADVVDIGLVLDLARDAAHGIARPAAPLTTFIVGYAAALAGGSPEDVRRIAAIATRLATAP
ncbi:DUF6457 domain-containing protein [Cryobacterium tagatosivorans]|uniref:DUF6457 domain-containing protein n=1 Tax=Cryobacterium tagatosivorans TaxID=1259199 RepID=UPI0018E07E82|nr:DUF6457 domain-containing protein [Cryobacterium tagatosivorans]